MVRARDRHATPANQPGEGSLMGTWILRLRLQPDGGVPRRPRLGPSGGVPRRPRLGPSGGVPRRPRLGDRPARRSGRRCLTAALPALIAVGCLTSGCSSDSANASATDSGTSPEAGGATVPKVKIDRSGLTNVGTDKPLDYSDPNLWLCRPGNDPDECDADLDSTELLPDGTRKLVKHVKAVNPNTTASTCTRRSSSRAPGR